MPNRFPWEPPWWSGIVAALERDTSGWRKYIEAQERQTEELTRVTEAILGTSFHRDMDAAARSLAAMSGAQAAAEAFQSNIGGGHSAWLDRKKELDSIAALTGEAGGAFQAALRSDFSWLTRITAAADVLFSRADSQRLVETFGFGAQLGTEIQRALESLTGNYADLVDSRRSPRFTELPPAVIELSPVELFRAADLFYKAAPAGEPLPEEATSTVGEVRASVDSLRPIEDLLAELEPDLLIPLRGARDALESKSPDRVRHVTVSSRELFDHTLRRIAPDEKVRRWTQDPDHFDDKGRPTRRARIAYVTSRTSGSVSDPSLTAFAESDVTVTLKFLNLFQKGTHVLKSPTPDDELRAMERRMEDQIRILLEIARDLREH